MTLILVASFGNPTVPTPVRVWLKTLLLVAVGLTRLNSRQLDQELCIQRKTLMATPNYGSLMV